MKQRICYGVGLFLAAMGSLAPAHAVMTISASSTENITCAAGVCTPTATDANLNVGDLENYLAAGDLKVTTTGSGVQAGDIVVEAGFDWAGASALAFDAYHSVTFRSAVTDNGTGAVSLVTNDGGSGGTLLFISGGSLSFRKPKNNLSIQGECYKLANSLPALAADIAAKPSGNYALSASYDASQSGTYKQSPINTKFKGSFNGLGNTIYNLSIHGRSKELGLFAIVVATGSIASIRVANAVLEEGQNSIAGVIAGLNTGAIFNSSASGSISAKAGKKYASAVGGLVGVNQGTVASSAAATNVTVSGNSPLMFADVGGFVGYNAGLLEASYATGNAIASRGIGTAASGGLVGVSNGTVENSYALGAASIGASTCAGGFIGCNGFTVASSYSTGAPTPSDGPGVGGSIGLDGSTSGSLSNLYWDFDTSGITDPSQGAGNISNDPGITGETAAQLQAGLPAGFDPSIWAENPDINGGLPYLIANPPQ